jgi:hypothetical protein
MNDYTNRDLSKIDFSKLDGKLPKFEGCDLFVKREASWNNYFGVNLVATLYATDKSTWFAALSEFGNWYCNGTSTHLALQVELYSICKQVDAFIGSELAAMNEPNWVDVQWTEVERLEKAGACVEILGIYHHWNRRHADFRYTTGFSNDRYRIDLKTVPVGINLYEPEWVAVPWRDVEMLVKCRTTVQLRGYAGWAPKTSGDGHPQWDYQADAKTFPAGYIPKPDAAQQNPEPVKPLWDEIREKCVAGDSAFTVIQELCNILDSRMENIGSAGK